MLLVLFGAMNLFRGSVHLLKSDGGASSIAGIDLSQNGEVILTLFAAAGLVQLLMAAIDFAVAFRFRALVPWVMGYHAIQQIGATIIVWWWRPLPLAAPGKYGAALMVPVALVGLLAATRRRSDAGSAGAPAAAALDEPFHDVA